MTFNPILPNRASENTIRTYLFQRGIQHFQYKAGYCPDKLNIIENNLSLSPIKSHFSVCAKTVMKELCGTEVTDYNLRVPYLMLVWLLVGHDNPYKVLPFAPAAIPLAKHFLQIAVGMDLVQYLPSMTKLYQRKPTTPLWTPEGTAENIIYYAWWILDLSNRGADRGSRQTMQKFLESTVHIAWWHVTTQKMPKAHSEIMQMWVRWQARQAENKAREAIQKRAVECQSLEDIDLLPFIRTCIIDLYGVS